MPAPITNIGLHSPNVLVGSFSRAAKAVGKALGNLICVRNRPRDIVAATPVVSKPFGFEHKNAGQSGARAFQPDSLVSLQLPPKPKGYPLYSATANSGFATGAGGPPGSGSRSSTTAAPQVVSQRPVPPPTPTPTPKDLNLRTGSASVVAPTNANRVSRSDSCDSSVPPNFMPPSPRAYQNAQAMARVLSHPNYSSDSCDSACCGSSVPPNSTPPPSASDDEIEMVTAAEIEMVTEAFSFLEPLPGSMVLGPDDDPVSYV